MTNQEHKYKPVEVEGWFEDMLHNIIEEQGRWWEVIDYNGQWDQKTGDATLTLKLDNGQKVIISFEVTDPEPQLEPAAVWNALKDLGPDEEDFIERMGGLAKIEELQSRAEQTIGTYGRFKYEADIFEFIQFETTVAEAKLLTSYLDAEGLAYEPGQLTISEFVHHEVLR